MWEFNFLDIPEEHTAKAQDKKNMRVDEKP